MPYPIDTPKTKHDLNTPPLPSSESQPVLEEFLYTASASLLNDVSSPAPPVRKDSRPLCSVYSYSDAPEIPLSRSLMIIGVADVTLSAIRRLVEDDDDGAVPPCLHKCTIAVKRADADNYRKLNETDRTNSTSFAKLVRRLRKDGRVAIISPDKHQRFGILKPMEDVSMEGPFNGQDFAALCFVGEAGKVKEFLTTGLRVADLGGSGTRLQPLSKPDVPSWKPPGDDDPEYSGSLWQPPSSSDNATNGFWQPPNSWQGSTSEGFTGESSFSWNVRDDDKAGSISNERKRPRDENGSSNEFHADKGAAAADAFYSGLTRTLDTRHQSRIYHMRAFNGWVKAIQIQELNPKTKQPGTREIGKGALRVLDLACGKGGDLGKWILHHRGIDNYVGSDVARGSLRDAAIRARLVRHKLKKCTFVCADLGADVPGRLKSNKQKQMQKLLTWSLQSEPKGTKSDPEFRMVRGGGISVEERFDVVSIQFAIHYMMSTRARARRFFRTVSELLDVGGNLIATTIDARVVIEHMMNLGIDLHFDDDKSLLDHPGALIQVGAGACRLKFEPHYVKRIFHDNASDDDRLFGLEYTFTLVEGRDHAAGIGDAVNLPEWLTPVPALKSLAAEAGLELEYVQNFHEFYQMRKDPNHYGAAHHSLYSMNVLNRHGSISEDEWEISRLYCAIKFRKVKEITQPFEQDDNEVDDDDEIDPALKAKLLPMAMLKAKRSVGAEEWSLLPSEEKTRLTELELEELAKNHDAKSA